MKKACCFIVLLVVLSTFFSVNLFKGEALVPVDMLGKELPWKAVFSISNLKNHYMGDITAVFYPWKMFSKREFEKGRFPLWCPDIGTGYPFFASGRTGTININTLILLLFDLPLGSDIFFFFQLLFITVTTFALLRYYKVSYAASIFGSLSFALCFPVIDHLPFEHIVGGVMWIPSIILSLEKFSETKRYRWLSLGALLIGMAFINGSLQSFLYVLLVVFIFFTFTIWMDRRISTVDGIKYLIILGVLSALVSSVALLPRFELVSLSEREISSTSQVMVWLKTFWKKPLLVPFLTAGTVWPDLIGNVHGLDLVKILGHIGGRGGRLSGELFKPYVGLIGFLCGLVAFIFVRDRRVKLYGLITFVPLLLTIFTPLYLLLYMRVTIVTAFGLAMVGAFGLDALLQGGLSGRLHRFSRYLLIGLIVVLVLFTLFQVVLFLFYDPLLNRIQSFILSHITQAQLYAYDVDWQIGKGERFLKTYFFYNPAMWKFFVLGFIFWLAIKLTERRSACLLIACVILIAANTADLFYTGNQHLPWVDRKYIFPETKAIRFLKDKQKSEGLFRVTSIWDNRKEPPVFRPNELLPYGIQDPRVYESLFPRQDLLNEGLWDLLNVKYVVTPPGYPPPRNGYRKVYSDEVDIWENPYALPRAFIVREFEVCSSDEEVLKKLTSPGFNPMEKVLISQRPEIPLFLKENTQDDTENKAEIELYEPNRVKVRVWGNGGILVLSERNYPGWRAYLDGKKIRLYNAFVYLRCVFVPPGEHTVEFRFEPLSLKLGSILSMFGIVISFIGIIGIAARRK